MKKLLSIVLAAILAFSVVGCGEKKEASSSEKVQITVGAWPSEKTSPELRKKYDAMKERFEK